jgi:hypothetical protein
MLEDSYNWHIYFLYFWYYLINKGEIYYGKFNLCNW